MRFTKSDGFYNFNHVQAEQIDKITTNNNGDVFVTVKSGETPNWLKTWVRTNNPEILRDENDEIIGMKISDLEYLIGDYIVSVKEVANDDLHFLVIPARKVVFEKLFTPNYVLRRESDPYFDQNEVVATPDDLEDEDDYDSADEDDGWSGDYDASNEENEEESDNDDDDEIVSVETVDIPSRDEILALDDKFDNPNLLKLALASESRKALADTIHFGSKAVGRWVRVTKHEEVRDHFNK